MESKEVKNKDEIETAVTASWVYDEKLGWIDIDMHLLRIKRIQKEIRERLKKTS